MKSYKIKNVLNWESVNAFSENTNNITPNISIYKASQIKSPNIPIKQKFKQIIFSNNSQENPSLKNPNEKNISQEVNLSHSIFFHLNNLLEILLYHYYNILFLFHFLLLKWYYLYYHNLFH